MGYESKVYVVLPFSHINEDTGKQYCEIIADFNLSRCGDLLSIFKKPSKFIIHDHFMDGELDIDAYDKEPTMCEINDAIEFIKNNEDAMNYRRTRGLYDFLMSAKDHYDELYLVHYGY